MDAQLEELTRALSEARDLYDNAPCGYHSVDARGVFLQVNETELRWLGYTREELIGKANFMEMITPESHQKCAVRFAELQQKGRIEDVDVEIFRKNGTILPVLINAVAEYDESGAFVRSRATLFDITERRRAERKLEESEARLLAFLGNTPSLIFVKDLKGKYLYVNEAFLRAFSMEGKDVLFRTDADLFPPDQAALFQGHDARVLATGERLEFEETAKYPDGWHTSIVHKFPIRDDSGEVVALGGIATDITERKRFQEALGRVNRALRVVSGTNEAVIHAGSEGDLYERLCAMIVQQGGYKMAWVGFAQDDMQKTVCPVAQSGSDQEYLRNIRITWADDALGGGPTGMAIKTGQVQLNHNVLLNPAMAPWRDECVSRGFHSSIALPLRSGGRVFGALMIYAGEPNAFDAEEVALLTRLAVDLSFGIDAIRTRLERERAEASVHRLAYFDVLTGLPNRVSLREKIDAMISSARPFALVLCNVQHFTEIQDGLGVRQADMILQKIASRVEHAAGDRFVARLEGDRFAVVLPESGEIAVREFSRRLQEVLEDPIEQAEVQIDVRTHIGAALFPEHGVDPDALLLRSDIASRQAKSLTMPYVLYSGATDQESPRRIAMIAELRRAIAAGQMVLYFQPKIDLETNLLCGVEALVRWKHPERGLVPPAEFIPIAEHTGLIRPLTEWVLGAAVHQISRWSEAGVEVPVAVNVSPQNLRDPDLYDKIAELCSRAKIPGRLLELEITETTLMEDPARSHDVLTRLRDLGIRTFVDDFGTGYSSLSYIATLPIHALKIDRSFIVRMTQQPEHRAIVAAAVSLAHSLGLRVVAEGVDADSQVALLRDLRCDEVQGFLFSKPLPPDEFAVWRKRFLP